MIVIDTQALVWLFQADERLGSRARNVIQEARTGDGVFIPAIMTWEIGMLIDKDRVTLGMEPRTWFESILGEPGFEMLPMNMAIGIDAGTLPGSIHGDPADRMMIASARAVRAPLLTADRKILRYAAAGHVQVIDARR